MQHADIIVYWSYSVPSHAEFSATVLNSQFQDLNFSYLGFPIKYLVWLTTMFYIGISQNHTLKQEN